MKNLIEKINQEILARNKLFTSLEESELKRYALLSVLPITTFETDHTGKIKTLNDKSLPKIGINTEMIWESFKGYDQDKWNEWIVHDDNNTLQTRSVLVTTDQWTVRNCFCTPIRVTNTVVGSLISTEIDLNNQQKTNLPENQNIYPYINTFLSNISDTLRTPLSCISMNAEMLTIGNTSEPKTRNNFIKSILSSVKDIDDHLKFIELYCNVTSNTLNKNKSPLCTDDLQKYISQYKSEYYPKLTITTNLIPSSYKIAGKQSYLHCLLKCALDNSVQNTSSAVKVNLQIKIDKTPYLSIEVIDNSPDFSPECLGIYVKPGVTKNSQLNRVRKNLGLGLTYVCSYLDLIEGHCYLSKLKNWNIFNLRIPLYET